MRRLVFLLAVFVFPLVSYADNVIIRCQRPCAAARAAVLNAGGSVTIAYKYVDAIAATVPGIDKLNLPAGSVMKDLIVAQPRVARDRDGSAMLASVESDAAPQALDRAAIAQIASQQPGGYLSNDASLNLGPLFAAGKDGSGMRVAVIDSGIRPGYPHISLDGSVIGGEDFVGDALGWINSGNNGHGTFVAGMISTNVLFSGSGLVGLVQPVCPTCVIQIGTTKFVPMLGSAPSSSIYALRVFGAAGGAPESRIIAAMERVLELRDNYNATGVETKVGDKYTSLNVKVCNMSLGGATLFAGRDVEDQLTKAFLDHDIVLVTSAGNAGPSGTTVGGPGTGFGTITVGASSDAIHENILRRLQFGAALGSLYRPFGGTQMAYFSSRGPDADGRTDPDVVANGFASFGQGFSAATSLDFASGTSFSSPTTAGVAAVLRQAVPGATARQVRNAIIMSANPNVLSDGSGVNDQGAGYVDANAAYQLLQAGGAPNTDGIESNPKKKVEQNIPYLEGNVTRTAVNLKPGQRSEIYYKLKADTQNVIITVSNVQRGATQNALFGDDIILTVHSAKTSAIDEGDYKVFEFTTGGTFAVQNAESGLMRVTLSGDWTNASPITATVTLSTISDNIPDKHTAKQKIVEGDLVPITFNVPAGTQKLTARLEWNDDWSSYPTDDLDLYLVTPAGGLNVDGGTLNSPETVSIANPAAGDWTAYVAGFTVWGNDEKYNLIISADGKVIKGK